MCVSVGNAGWGPKISLESEKQRWNSDLKMGTGWYREGLGVSSSEAWELALMNSVMSSIGMGRQLRTGLLMHWS